MRKLLIVIISSLLFLTGCSAIGRVETMTGWSFQYNEGTNDYSLFFGLCDSAERYVSTSATVKIKIVNDNEEVVYEGTKEISKNDFGTYSSQIAGERYLADIRIAKSEIAEGSSANGKVYFSVSNSDEFSFDEVNCAAFGCLPTKDIEVNVGTLPIGLSQKDLWGSTESEITITNITYKYDAGSGYPSVRFEITGEKTFQRTNSSSNNIISYKIYDSKGFLIKSGHVYLDTSLSKGEKFKDDSLVIYDLTPGETYTFQLMSYEY